MMNAKMKEILMQEKADEEKNKEIMLILLDVARTQASSRWHPEEAAMTRTENSFRL